MIKLSNVSKSFGEQVVLDGVSLEVGRAETKIVLGGSGSGKSTILKLILGLEQTSSGRILVDDEDITDYSEYKLFPVRKKIGMVFQEGALFDSLTVGDNVAYRMHEDGLMGDEEIEAVVLRLLGFVGLEEAIDKTPAQLSGGMRRRVAIARALVGSPRIMLYDEPTAGLDPITSRTICELVIKLRDLEGVSSIFVTHDLKSAFMLANQFAVVQSNGEVVMKEESNDLCLINTRFVMLRGGHILFEGTDEELRTSTDPYIREFVT